MRKNQLTLKTVTSRTEPKALKLREWKPRESEFQRDLFDWAKHAEGQYPELAFMYAVPNGAVAGPDRFATVAWMKNQGMKTGVPDVVLPAMRSRPLIRNNGLIHYWPGLYAELKTETGEVGPLQTPWHEYFEAAGYMMAIFRSLEHACEALKFYLDLPRPPWVATTAQFKRLRDQYNDALRAEEQAATMRRNKRRLLKRIGG